MFGLIALVWTVTAIFGVIVSHSQSYADVPEFQRATIKHERSVFTVVVCLVMCALSLGMGVVITMYPELNARINDIVGLHG